MHGNVSAYNMSRRGALLRKIGKLMRSQEDLEMAIKIEPHFLDAYWQRHLLYLLQGDHYVRKIIIIFCLLLKVVYYLYRV